LALFCVAATAGQWTRRPAGTTSTTGPTASVSPTAHQQDCWPYCPNNNTYLANPRNCSTYYSCTGSLDGILQACPTGLVFVPEEQGCDWPDVYNCTDDPDAPCATQPPTQPTSLAPETSPQPNTGRTIFPRRTTLAPETSPQPTTGRTFFPPRRLLQSGSDDVAAAEELPVCSDPVCIRSEGLQSNPGDCSTYYSCFENVPTLMKCPEGLHFHQNDPPFVGRCKWVDWAKCSETCVPPQE